MKNKLLFITNLLLISTSFISCKKKYPIVTHSKTEVPKSINHFNGTWWGYNMKKIGRINNKVYSYYIDNVTETSNNSADANNPNYAKLFYLEDGDTTLHFFDSLPTSRPGNILVDSINNLVYYVNIIPMDTTVGGSLGKLVLYKYDTLGTRLDTTLLIPGTTQFPETVNIRLGANIDNLGRIVCAWGSWERGKSLKVLTYDGTTIKQEYAVDSIGEDNYYPFIVNKDSTYHVLAVQDNCTSGSCIYHYTRVASKYDGGNWIDSIATDYRGTYAATLRGNVVEPTELIMNPNNEGVWITRAFMDQNYTSQIVINGTEISMFDNNVNWVKMFYINSKLYYLTASWNQIFLLDYEFEKIFQVPTNIQGSYIYTYQYKNNIDLYVIPGSLSNYNSNSEIHKIQINTP